MEFRVTKGGSVTLKITATSDGYQLDRLKGVADIFTFFEDLDVPIDIMGVEAHPTVIVKIYCKLDKTQRRDIQKQEVLKAAREGSPILW